MPHTIAWATRVRQRREGRLSLTDRFDICADRRAQTIAPPTFTIDAMDSTGHEWSRAPQAFEC